MSFRNTRIEHPISDETQRWLDQEIAEQRERHAQIVRDMEALAPQRAQWYEEFLDRLTRYGFNVDGDEKRLIAAADLPIQPPGRADRVVW